MNTESDNYSIVHDMLDKAVQNFGENGNNRINLVDIAAYEKMGPEQKQIGQFLEKNMALLRGFDTNEKPHDYLDLGDLELAALYSGDDQKTINQARNNQVMKEVGEVSAVVGGVTFGGAALGAGIFGPETLVISAPFATIATGGAAVKTYMQAMDKQTTMQIKSQELIP